MPRPLPLAPGPAGPCTGCPAPCCQQHTVPVEGYDLVRLVRGLGRPWHDLIEVDTYPAYSPRGFCLHAGGARHGFVLRRSRPEAPCPLWDPDPAAPARCTAYPHRPAACRVYPLLAADDEPTGSFVLGLALCPEQAKRRFWLLRPELRPVIDDDLAELQLYVRIVSRWNHHAERTPAQAGLSVDQYVAWLLRLYAELEPLRQPDRGAWQLTAYRLVDRFPVPWQGGSDF
ncbi:MAG: YkgJ family cysteine cluster protein [Myxococcales bacterium]|nr:YkgJ family cysteine cluster protein [Myxococcota bacterium]MDW8280888.1 YkgJ family cysteine cluster protein [Myxococcales bacterium]